jgi:uncharacterized repeat protein (TIGR03803 family)
MRQIKQGCDVGRPRWWKTLCAVSVVCAATAIALPAQTFTTLYSFDFTDGASPLAGLIQATDGSLYGTTGHGGANGEGTVFKITPSGTVTTLYNFCSQSGCTDGSLPEAELIEGTDGSFYGTTYGGGANRAGTVFQITPGGTLTTLYSFCAREQCLDGSYPVGTLVQGTDGNLYGTTTEGGAGGVYSTCHPRCGTVFKISPSGAFGTLHSFNFTDGSIPLGGLIQATDGDFYGTTSEGGDGSFSCTNQFSGGHGSAGCGTVFKITANGTLTTLHNFCSEVVSYLCKDGTTPYAGLVQAADGTFYGTTTAGGGVGTNRACGITGCGTVFRITASGTLTTLLDFDILDGYFPEAALVQATDGNLYGTTEQGGANTACFDGSDGCGTVFKITPSGTLTTLYSFCPQTSCADGEEPQAGLVQDTNGQFYGTTTGGGANGDGTVFSLSVGLGRFVESQPTSGNVGAAVNILGTNLTTATSVTFNGTPATFNVVSSSLITTTVPAGATSGKVQVVTPVGTLTSNVPFRVLQ